MKYFVSVSKLNKSFNKQILFKDAEIHLPKYGLIGLNGPSGSGKSSLLKMLGGLDSSYKGSIVVNNISLKSLGENALRMYRINNVGFIFQDYPLLNQESVLDNVLLLLNATSKEDKIIKNKKGKNLLRQFDLSSRADEKAKNLSGGEKERVASCLCLTSDAKLLLADEPTASLDEKNGRKLFDALKNYSKNHLVIVSSHNIDLLERYCDQIYSIKDKKIKLEKCLENKKSGINPISTYNTRKKDKIGLSFLDRLKIAYKDLISKKFRFYLTLFCCFASFCFAGFSSYIRFSMEKEVKSALSSFSIPNQLIISRKDNVNPNLYPCDEKSLIALSEDYKEDVIDYGFHLNFDFPSLFKNDDSCFLLTLYQNIPLPYFSSKHINEFVWLKEVEEPIYPSGISSLEDDELVIGLPFDYLNSICLQLGIARSYESFGSYLSSNSVRFLLNVENKDIGFDDQELFTIKGITKTKLPLLLHSSSKWNKTIFIDKMNFRPDETGENPNPQYVYQLPFVYLKDKELFYRNIKNDDRYSLLYFEPNSSLYLSSTCDASFCLSNRVYVYKSNHNEESCFNQIIDTGVPYLGLQHYGFYGSNETIFTGFLPQFFLSSSLDNLNSVSETVSTLETFSFDFLPSDVCSGNILTPFDKKIKISPILSSSNNLKSNDVLISKGLRNRLGNKEHLFFSYEVSSSLNRDKIIRNFKNGSLNVIDVVDNEDLILYISPSLLEEYLFSYLGVSTFNLKKNGYVLFFSDQKQLLKCKENLERNMDGFYFLNVDDYVSSSMNQTTSYVGSLLLFSSIGTIFLSLLLFDFIMYTNYEDDKDTRRLFFSIGLPKKEEFCFFFYKSMILIVVASFLSSLMMFPLLFLGSKIIGNSFGSPIGFSFSYEPFLFITITFILYVISSLFIGKRLEKSENN